VSYQINRTTTLINISIKTRNVRDLKMTDLKMTRKVRRNTRISTRTSTVIRTSLKIKAKTKKKRR